MRVLPKMVRRMKTGLRIRVNISEIKNFKLIRICLDFGWFRLIF
jgi:hypothetical protein